MALRWRKIGKRHSFRNGRAQSSELHENGRRFAMVSPIGNKWYWVAGWDSGITYCNTCSQPEDTEEEAKAEAQAYVIARLHRIAWRILPQ